MGVRDQESWWRFVKEHADLVADLRLPAQPHIVFRKSWAGYDDWLGLDEDESTLFVPTQWGGDTSSS